MASRGVHFAISAAERLRLESLTSDSDRKYFVSNVIEKRWDEEFLFETDKAWDPIHRCLGEIPPVAPGILQGDPNADPLLQSDRYGSDPLRLCILGGKRLMEDEGPYIIRLIEPEQVPEIVRALRTIDRAWMRDNYFLRCDGTWPECGEEDFEDAWAYFEGLRDYFSDMAGNGHSIIFTVGR